jgi:hypothetical protein
MRITKDLLQKIARDAAAEEARRDRQVVCTYLTGSLLLDEPLLGGTTDIDLMVVHGSDPQVSREVRKVSDEITLDIAHLSQAVFIQPRHLRVDPWLGSYLVSAPQCLYELHHWFEFNQASVHAQFHQPDTVLHRARLQAEEARQGWINLHNNAGLPAPQRMLIYLKALEKAANAVATFSGPPLTERRFMLNFPARALAINRPGLADGLVDLFMPIGFPVEARQTWQNNWAGTLVAVSKLPTCPVRLQASRLPYYLRSAEAMWDDHPEAALWMVLHTWTLAINQLPADAGELAQWENARAELALDDAHFSHQLDALDSYLDAVEETMDWWAQQYGISA